MQYNKHLTLILIFIILYDILKCDCSNLTENIEKKLLNRCKRKLPLLFHGNWNNYCNVCIHI